MLPLPSHVLSHLKQAVLSKCYQSKFSVPPTSSQNDKTVQIYHLYIYTRSSPTLICASSYSINYQDN
ncbi:uncharacterized protein ATC70_008501 [Mucor velutinosus]|uniref:Uncharacterized protein n=1 Tax=Mucor velutinosus TaxID=708070 RepID=A0AAN7DN20_9FUNG|nr:hypothetical protein ATC70_008501 [Mucor velutinosus]